MFQKYKLIYSLFLLCCINTSHLHANELDDIIQNMPGNSWAKINQNQFSSVWTPLAQRPTSWSPGSNISGYSGAAWGDGKLWFFGGNIGQEYGNEVYTFDTDTLLWNRMSLPSQTQGTGSSEADAYPVDGLENAPRSGESWDNLAYLPNLDKFAVIDASFNGSGFGTGPYLFDPAKADPNRVGGTDGSHVDPLAYLDVLGGEMWENRDSTKSSHPVGATSAYTSVNGEDVVFYSNGGRNYDLWKWVVSPLGAHDDRWTQIGQRNGTEIGFALPGAGTFAPARNIFIRKSDNKLIYWDVDVGGLAEIVSPTTTGTDSFPSEESWGIDYDNTNDVFYLWNGRRKIWKLKPPAILGRGQWAATLLRPPGEAPTATVQPGIFGKWYYMEKYGAFIGAADDEGNIHVYKPAPNPPPAPIPPLTGDEIDFNEQTIDVYASNQDIEGEVAIEDDGATLSITGNIWRQIAFNYEITESTILEFDFSSSSIGEIHAIGLDDDLVQSKDFVFQIYGLDTWGDQTFNTYSGNGEVQRFTIPIGQYYTGPMEYVFFVMDDDITDPQGESKFSNLNIYERKLISPEITSTANTYTLTNTLFLYDQDSFIQASGTAPMSFSLIEGPQGLQVSTEGYVAWVPTPEQAGEHEIEISVENEAGSNSQQFTVTVLLDTDNDGSPNTCDTDCQAAGFEQDLDDDNDGLPDSFELTYGLDPTDNADAILDGDLDSLSNLVEFAYGTNPTSNDTDSDNIPDNIDNNPLTVDTAELSLYSGQLVELPDVNSDGVKEVGILSVVSELSNISLEVFSGKSLESLNKVVWSDIYSDESLSVHILQNNGEIQIGLFGVRDSQNNEGKPQLFVRNLITGVRANVFNWPANWKYTSVKLLSDLNGDGIAEVALQGRFKEGLRPQLVIKNGANASALETYSYPNLFSDPEFYQHSDMDDDGIGEISTFGRITRNNKIQIKVASGIDSQDRLKAYNFPDKWSNVSWIKLSDSNNDGVEDWGLFGTSKSDNRAQLIVKNGTDPRGALRIHAWPAQIESASFFAVPDMNSDGVDEVAAAGIRTNGRHQFQIQDGVDRNKVLANHNLNLSLNNVSYHVLPDLTGDNKSEVGFLGINADGDYELIIRDGDTNNGELRTENLGSDWAHTPSIVKVGDTDDDGTPNLVIAGKKGSSQVLGFMSIL